MAWVTPKTDWTSVDGVDFDDFNRIEGNIAFIGTNPSGDDLRLAPDGGDVLIAGSLEGSPDYGDIGTIVVAVSSAHSVVSTQHLPNTTVAGSTLYHGTGTPNAGAALAADTVTNMVVSSATWTSFGFTGTWRLLTRVYKGTGASSYPVGLFQRIS